MKGAPTPGRAGLSALVVDDDPAVPAIVEIYAAASGFASVESAATAAAALEALRVRPFDLVLLDLGLPDRPEKGLLREFLSSADPAPVAVVTADDRIETAVGCMREGAFDFVEKPLSPARLISLFSHAAEKARFGRIIGEGAGVRSAAFAGIVAESALMLDLFRAAERIAPSGLPVLISGESGTGKELVAKALHDLSGRDGEFVTVNTAGLDGTLFSDVLFGHVKGAYTGAEGTREGLVRRAERGTLFLDEIGDIGSEVQVKLLRFLQDGEFYQLGSDRKEYADCRLVLATNADLYDGVRKKTFRADLYYRLSSHPLVIPPLRERREDIGPLAAHFAAKAANRLGRDRIETDEAFVAVLANYGFPGNVRELAAIVEGAAAASANGRISASFARAYIARHARETAPAAAACADYPDLPDGRFPTLEEIEERHIAEALRRTGGNQSAAAALLGVAQSTISRKLRRG